ncbi:MAG: TerB family tellurite resistance protein [Flavobacteriaceae bacterium]|nr:TerB family tellurite resistance protein [Flavobacteriaceae bacterium]
MTKPEILSLLSEMIAFAETDGKLVEREMDFLKAVAKQLKVSDDVFAQLLQNRADYVPLKPESQRILQFYRLVLLMNVDENISEQEVKAVYAFGLKMGLQADAITSVLESMHQFPNKIIPPEKLIEIFKRQHN